MSLLSRTVCLPDFCRVLSCNTLLQSIWTFYGDVIYMALWHVNDARKPCLPSIFMNNCVRGAVELAGRGRDRHTSTKSLPSTESGWWSCWGLWFTCLQALAHLFIQTSRIPREEINEKRTKKQQAGMWVFNKRLSNFNSTDRLLAYKLHLTTSEVARIKCFYTTNQKIYWYLFLRYIWVK